MKNNPMKLTNNKTKFHAQKHGFIQNKNNTIHYTKTIQ